MDPLIHRYLTHVETRHRQSGWLTDMDALAEQAGYAVHPGERSVFIPGHRIEISRHVTVVQKRADLAHELAHAFAEEAGLGALLEHEHASVAPHLREHVENVNDHASDRLLMPEVLVEELARRVGWNAELVYQVAVFASADLEQAMRRLAYYHADSRRVIFLLLGSYVAHVAANQDYPPFWQGQRLPEPHLMQEHGVHLFKVPGRKNATLGWLDTTL